MNRDKVLTPGAIDRSLNAAYLCSTSTKARRTATTEEKRSVYEAYGIPKIKRVLYRLDDIVPLELGGVNTAKNLWPQTLIDSIAKDREENKIHKMVCRGEMTLAAAQQYFLENW